MPPESPSPTPQDAGATNAWIRPVAVILSCLVLGFIGGWVLRGDEGEVTVLAPTAEGGGGAIGTTPDAPAGTATTGTGTAGTGTTPADTAGAVPGDTAGTMPGETAGTAPGAAAPDRGDVRLTVLNGTAVAGLAASTAERAETLGYRDVQTGNAPSGSGPSVVYYRTPAREAAERTATDLEIVSVRALPRSGPLAEAAPGDAEVIVVLGSG